MMRSMENTIRPIALLVDDEPVCLEITRRWLEDFGWAVTAVPMPEQALSLCAAQIFDLLVTDVMFGEDHPDGFELAMEAAKLRPGLQTIFCSAKAWGPSQAMVPDTTFLHKPFSRAELAHSIAFALANG
jgi:CheY-like chemotaxis protein